MSPNMPAKSRRSVSTLKGGKFLPAVIIAVVAATSSTRLSAQSPEATPHSAITSLLTASCGMSPPCRPTMAR